MNVLGWAMLALGFFLVLYTVAFLVRKGESGREKLGCGFVLLAGLVWSIALTQFVGSSQHGLRLGFGAAFVLPALAALFKGGRKKIVPAAVFFIAGILLASSSLPALKERVAPSKARTTALDMSKGVQALRSRIQKRDEHLASLRAADARLKGEIKRLDVTDFEAAMSNPEARRVIEELSEVTRLRKSAEANQDSDRIALKKLESELRRAERRAQADAMVQAEEQDEKLDALLSEVTADDGMVSPSTVEAYSEREAMRTLFDEVRE
jgi:hypothetical protein